MPGLHSRLPESESLGMRPGHAYILLNSTRFLCISWKNKVEEKVILDNIYGD